MVVNSTLQTSRCRIYGVETNKGDAIFQSSSAYPQITQIFTDGFERYNVKPGSGWSLFRTRARPETENSCRFRPLTAHFRHPALLDLDPGGLFLFRRICALFQVLYPFVHQGSDRLQKLDAGEIHMFEES